SVFDWPKDGKLVVPGLQQPVISAKLLATGKTVSTSGTNDGLVITLPEKAPDTIASVIKVQVKGIVPVKGFTAGTAK
ncbi:MAG TPA: alpha-L-fucosidase, partial [Niastella sp.]